MVNARISAAKSSKRKPAPNAVNGTAPPRRLVNAKRRLRECLAVKEVGSSSQSAAADRTSPSPTESINSAASSGVSADPISAGIAGGPSVLATAYLGFGRHIGVAAPSARAGPGSPICAESSEGAESRALAKRLARTPWRVVAFSQAR
jgi:hypothetical protein